MAEPAHLSPRLARAKFRAWHRGTREADYMFGCYFDTFHTAWDEAALAWFEALLEEEDVDVLAWALGTAEPPVRLQGGQMDALRKFDYVSI
ncbi:hypothetical protein CP97_09215 [Aurantiacibacter atlanticus]|uniref:FAD assembly factor SdhE n=1 Tax=Aurantiacibacter atlanticus TaxID=1648404 RepID=A0A0H4VBX5_9SPHN|nr:succinate dehydrogenase assembly factor 2 [Aurantiacibacter atlanticus]AKQ42157.1 hypothetical protein CP97_09215 [Aurantiacibacter atlanticus]